MDLPPEELRARLAAGKVYLPESARAARENFFRPGNLSALRELALRFAAEHVGQDVLAYRQAQGIADPWKSGQRLLVAVSASPTSASLVRWTRRLAGELQAPWLAVYVELPQPLTTDEQARLARHLALARELGAQVVTTTDDDVARGLLRVAREQNATQLVVGKPVGWRALDLLRGGSLLNRLIRESGHIDIHAVRAEGEAPLLRPLAPPRFDARFRPRLRRGARLRRRRHRPERDSPALAGLPIAGADLPAQRRRAGDVCGPRPDAGCGDADGAAVELSASCRRSSRFASRA